MNTYQRLLDSAQQLLWERGYVGTSPKAIQTLAGVGQGSMYHHFSGKPALALAAIRRSSAQRMDLAEDQFDQPGTAVERVAGYLRWSRDIQSGCPIGRLAQDPEIVADPELREPLAATFAHLQELIAGVLARGVERGELDPALDPVTTAATVVAVLQGGYVLARSAGSDEPFHQAVEGAIALLAARQL